MALNSPNNKFTLDTNNQDYKEVRESFQLLLLALSAKTEAEWDEIVKTGGNNNTNDSGVIYISTCRGLFIGSDNSYKDDYLELSITSYDDTTHIRIDGSGNHMRAHIHIGVKDKHHAASIAIDNGELMIGGEDIPEWKINRIRIWVLENQAVLQKMWRCMNPWGNSDDAKQRIPKLTEF